MPFPLLIPLAMSAIGAIAGKAAQGRGQARQQQENAQLERDRLNLQGEQFNLQAPRYRLGTSARAALGTAPMNRAEFGGRGSGRVKFTGGYNSRPDPRFRALANSVMEGELEAQLRGPAWRGATGSPRAGFVDKLLPWLSVAGGAADVWNYARRPGGGSSQSDIQL